MKLLKDIDVINKRVLVRCDFNVPLDKSGNILDDFKIRQTLPTIKYLIENRAKIILMSHLDPESTNVVDHKFNLDEIAVRLAEYLNFSIEKEDDCVGPEAENEANKLPFGHVLLLENLRFHKEETDNDQEFAKRLSFLGDVYVNDAFGVDHRNHASIVSVPQLMQNCAGFLLEKEVIALDKIIQDPEKPMVAIIGGRKVETKSKFIDNISKVANFVIIGGLLAKEISEKNIKFKFPEKIVTPVGQLDSLDINEESVKLFREKISGAKTILWNGPFGKFEDARYMEGTLALADAIIRSKAFSVVGGGETVEFLEKRGIIEKFSHVSTGGGAMLAYLAGDKLPGIEALN
jgi:phosphoglycerate kinase